MSQQEVTTYLDEELLPLPFCPGCGHASVVGQLNAALVRLQLDPRQVVIVTDIGCQGLSDRYFRTNAFHGLHGRAITYATGMKLVNPDLKVIALVGDGGCGIGGHHLISAARRNIGLTVLVFNNLNFGMTGGEHSATTPPGALTITTRYGHLERPLDICSTVAVNGATFVARSMSYDKSLSELIAQAITHDGFALLDIWEMCTAYFVPNNRLNRQRLENMLVSAGFSTGILHQEERAEYSRAYRAAVSDQVGRSALPAHPLDTRYESSLASTLYCCIAGMAGKKIGTAAGMFSQGAILSGLWATQRNDYPVTVRSGYSVSEVVLSRDDTFQLGYSNPDLMVVLFPEGLKHERDRIASLTPEATLFIDTSLLPVTTGARVVPLDFSGTNRRKEYWAVMAMAEVLRYLPIYPLEALKEAVSLRREFVQENLEAVEASAGLAQW
jgi:pyruvate/2-oxoacid:ferredoxin oxidoreductase beta subunit/Pyruvate/2-oxoacid:ferredoxin oxidoreductase gamma subunit